MNLQLARILYRLRSLIARTGLTRLPFLQSVKRSFVSVSLDGIRLTIPRRFLSHYIGNDYEPATLASLTDVLRPGMTFIDVGAHIGYYALVAARAVGPEGRVFAVEPAEDNQGYLRRNVASNPFGNIRVHANAAGRERTRRTFHITGSSDSHGFFPHPNIETVRTVEVEEIPVDDLVSGPVHAAKIDVEGVELLVLDGMQRILAENPHIVLWIEWMPACMRNAGYDPLALPERLAALGFDNIEVIDDLGGRRFPLEDAVEQVRSGRLPVHWYVNLQARRRQ